MYLGMQLQKDMADYIVKVILQDKDVKAELAKQIQAQNNTVKNKYSQYNRASFDDLTKGDVNLQLRMAQNGYDFYGNTIIGSLANTSNNSTYQKMKNKIRYGKRPEKGYENRGGHNVI